MPDASTDPALHCPTCGYNLTGLPENRCPECGGSFDREVLRKHRARISRPITVRDWLLHLGGVPLLFLILSASTMFLHNLGGDWVIVALFPMVLCVLVVLPLNFTNASILACRLVDWYEYRRHRETGLTGDFVVCILIGISFVATLIVCVLVMGALALLLH